MAKLPEKLPDKVELQKDQSLPAQVASPLATLSSHVDPEPHYIASLVCAGSAAALNMRQHPRAAAAAAGFSLLYLSAGRLIITGRPQLGYDLSSATSLGLLAWAGMKPGTGHGATNAILTTVAGISSVPNLIKSYQYRMGRPHEVLEK